MCPQPHARKRIESMLQNGRRPSRWAKGMMNWRGRRGGGGGGRKACKSHGRTKPGIASGDDGRRTGKRSQRSLRGGAQASPPTCGVVAGQPCCCPSRPRAESHQNKSSSSSAVAVLRCADPPAGAAPPWCVEKPPHWAPVDATGEPHAALAWACGSGAFAPATKAPGPDPPTAAQAGWAEAPNQPSPPPGATSESAWASSLAASSAVRLRARPWEAALLLGQALGRATEPGEAAQPPGAPCSATGHGPAGVLLPPEEAAAWTDALGVWPSAAEATPKLAGNGLNVLCVAEPGEPRPLEVPCCAPQPLAPMRSDDALSPREAQKASISARLSSLPSSMPPRAIMESGTWDPKPPLWYRTRYCGWPPTGKLSITARPIGVSTT